MVVSALKNHKAISAGTRRAGWLCFALIIVIALLIERRIPSFSIVYSNQSKSAGCVLGLAIACKVTPALFVPYLAWKRSWKALAGFFEATRPRRVAGSRSSRRTRHWLGSMRMMPLGSGRGPSELAAKDKQSCYHENDY